MMPPGNTYLWIQVYEPFVASRRWWSIVIDCSAAFPPGAQNAIDRGEVRRPKFRTDGLDHLDADDRVVATRDLAIVEQLNIDPVGRRRLAAPGAAPTPAARATSVTVVTCAPRQAARTASSPHPVPISSSWVSAVNAGQVEQPIDLASLRRLERLVRCRPPKRSRSSRSSSHRETGRTGRSTSRSAARCSLVPHAGRWLPTAAGEPGTSDGLAVAGSGTRPGIRRANGVSKAGQVVGVPLGGHVAFAEPDQAVVADATEERIGSVNAHDRRAFAAAAPALPAATSIRTSSLAAARANTRRAMAACSGACGGGGRSVQGPGVDDDSTS